MKAAQDHISEIKARLATSAIIATVDIVAERITEYRGYFRHA